MALICVDEDGFRRVNEREKDTLRFTFAKAVGDYLIDIIKIEYDPSLAAIRKKGRVRNDKEIQMRSDYNPEDLKWMGVFIHEAAHIWQRETGRHREGKGGENYEYWHEQLPDLELQVEEHASAVEHWFYVTYGITKGLANWSNVEDRDWLWQVILEAFGFEEDDWLEVDPKLKKGPAVKLELDALQKLTEIWTPVIEDIRNRNHVPALRPKSANPRFP